MTLLPSSNDELLSMGSNELWNCYKALMEEESAEGNIGSDFIEETDLIKNGWKVKIPIWYIINKWYEVYPSTKRVKVLGFGTFSLYDFMEDLDERNKIMRKVIGTQMEDGSITEPRN